MNVIHAYRTGLVPNKKIAESFPENLARLQAERGETNYRLAKLLGVHQTSIANWKEGKIKPHPKHVRLLAEHFGVTVEELLRKDGDETRTG